MNTPDAVATLLADGYMGPRDPVAALRRGVVIPAHPLALTAARGLDERRQRALSRYYLAAGAGGLAVGVHTTQFAIRNPGIDLLQPVLALAAEEMNRHEAAVRRPLVRVAGICGPTRQAVHEARLARELGYQYGLVNLAALRGESVDALIAHCREVSEAIDVFGFYLQSAIGGVELPIEFWRGFCEIERVAAIKIAAFDRYRTLDVLRAVAESGRDDIALYTGNDDNILVDLATPFRFQVGAGTTTLQFVGGLLGQWAVWTSQAVKLHESLRGSGTEARLQGDELLTLAAELTDVNAVIFDAAHGFRGCIPGIHEVLRRQGLLEGVWCLDEQEQLSPGQSAEIDRVTAAYPHLVDDEFVREHRDEWLSG